MGKVEKGQELEKIFIFNLPKRGRQKESKRKKHKAATNKKQKNLSIEMAKKESSLIRECITTKLYGTYIDTRSQLAHQKIRVNHTNA